MNIVLHEPGIALNTGNIGRSCAATDSSLHLIRPYGFRISEKDIKRAGMDYWEKIDLYEYIDYEDFLEKHPEISFEGEREETKTFEADNNGFGSSLPNCRDSQAAEHNDRADGNAPKLWFATTKAKHAYTEVCYGPNDYIMLGNESAGIPEEILVKHPDACIRIPMWGHIRSLNLSNAAAIILYEALRQNGFEDMERYGELRRLHWED